MPSDDEVLWKHCVFLGRAVLPVLDREPWRRGRRHERFRCWNIPPQTGENLIVVFAALVLRALLTGTAENGGPRSLRTLYGIPLRTVAADVGNRQVYELLAGLATDVIDEAEQTCIDVVRLLSYRCEGRTVRWLPGLGSELRHALGTVAERSRMPEPACGDLVRWAAEEGLTV
ncbi:hypothetical protein [Streptomyces sp. MST-110588]|uniref:hypothetical protein n=1 Tax=Streptomyces sp. MST-110588 TaxID=2833628 RepID=UPI001F5DA2D6|nr:hypothetical protein [Streptomyces sp. MST-110588]UNO43532.1 hypothetical protein KGS77_33730 [Streptomyces sp. MST-110588]